MSGKPIHFDLAEVEQVSRQTLAAAIARARAAVGDAPGRQKDRHLIDVQERIYEVNVTASVAIAALRNDGASTRAINVALGGSLGSIAASWMRMIAADPAAAPAAGREFMASFGVAVSDLLAGRGDDGHATRERASIRGVEGGTA